MPISAAVFDMIACMFRHAFASLLFVLGCFAETVPLNLTAVQPGPISVTAGTGTAIVAWEDADGRPWRATFSLDPKTPLIQSITVNGLIVLEKAQPIYNIETGKRRGGWDAFFDFPPSHPDGTTRFLADFKLTKASASSQGDRVEMEFEGLKMGLFEGTINYIFFPRTRLIEQVAVVKTEEPDTAFFYDAGLKMGVEQDRRAGNNMDTAVVYYDTEGRLATARPQGSERHPLAVRHRTIAVSGGKGSVAVFPPPHQYFFARDYSTNMANLWATAWRGNVSIGIRQLPDDNSPFYPWMNAPPETEQRLGMFILLSDGEPKDVLGEVLRYTNNDRYPKIEGFKTVAPHWHYAYTVQAMANGLNWVPPFKPVLIAMGVDAAVIMDFHGDGHPADLTNLRLEELEQFYKACRAQSGDDFLLIPGEEANVHFGGHWSVIFPKPVYWHMKALDGKPMKEADPKFGQVYHIKDAAQLLEMLREEKGWAYQTHPRTKGSTGFPDKIRDTAHFRDPRYFGVGWKQMPSDLSSPRLGERSLKLIDDISNWGLRKVIMGEVDIFQIDHTHELYAHMNINYVRIPKLPPFEQYGDLLEPLAKGDSFISTGEVLLPEVRITAGPSGQIHVAAKITHTFPLEMAEVIFGDGITVQRHMLPILKTTQFTTEDFSLTIPGKQWKWARFAVWDVAGNGAMISPVWR